MSSKKVLESAKLDLARAEMLGKEKRYGEAIALVLSAQTKAAMILAGVFDEEDKI